MIKPFFPVRLFNPIIPPSPAHAVRSPLSAIRYTLYALAVLLPGLGVGQPAIASAMAAGDRLLLAQQVVDGLPPPPTFDSEPAQLGEPLQFDDATLPDQLYLVYVNGDSPLLLEQVKQIEPNAILQDYNGRRVILVGLFEQSGYAEEKVGQLAAQGIEAEVDPVSSVAFAPIAPQNSASGFATTPSLPPADLSAVTPEPSANSAREIEFEPSPSLEDPYSAAAAPTSQAQPPGELPDDAFYLVIPASRDELPQLREQVILLGAQQGAVLERERPRGPHVLVGPFVDRRAASRWNRFLRDFGLDSRVYFQR